MSQTYQKGKRKRQNFQEWSYSQVQTWLEEIARERLCLNPENIEKVKTLATSGHTFSLLTQEQLIQQVLASGLSQIIGINLYNELQAQLAEEKSHEKKARQETDLPGEPLDLESPFGQFVQALISKQITLKEIIYQEDNLKQEKALVLSLPDGIYWWGRSKLGSHLFIRSSYQKMENLLSNHRLGRDLEVGFTRLNGFIISGTPGIGKSSFLPYLFWSWYTEYENIVIDLADEEESYLWQNQKDQATPQIRKANFKNFLSFVGQPTTLYLFDGSGRHFITVPRCFTVAAFSPNRENYKDFVKKGGKTRIFMPLWTLAELETCRSACYYETSVSLERLRELYSCWGGVIRWTLERANDKDNLDWLENDINRCDFSTAIQIVKTSRVIDTPGEITHTILHLKVLETEGDKPFVRVGIEFASKYILDRILEGLNEKRLAISIQFVKESTNDRSLAAVRGQVFEVLVHRQMIEGIGSLKVRSLEDSRIGVDNKKRKNPVKEITFKKRKLKIIDTTDDILTLKDNEYGQPRSKSFAAADAILAPDTFLQMTVSLDHGIVTEGAKQIVEKLIARKSTPSPVIKCYFIVPIDIFSHFKKQKWLNITNEDRKRQTLPPILNNLEQWVVCFDL